MAVSPGGREVARVSIRGVPDTSSFAADLKSKLDAIEKQVEFTLSIAVNDDQLEEQVDGTVAKAQAEAKKSPVRLPATVGDLDKAWQARIRAEVNAATKTIDANIPATIDGENLRRDLSLKLLELEKTLQATIPVDPKEAADFRAKVDAMVAEIEAYKPTIRVKASEDTASFTKLRATLLGLAAFGGSNPLTNLIGSLPKISAVALGIGSIGSLSLVAIRGLAGIVTQIGQLLPLASLLPGLLVGGALGVTALVIALKDAPQQLGSVASAYKSLGTVIDQNFWANATGPIKLLLNSLLPQLRSGFANVAGSLGTSIAGIAKAFQTGLTGGQLNTIFTGLNSSIQEAAPGLSAFSSAFLSLISYGAKYLPSFGSYVTKIGTDFASWVSGAENSGKLNTEITAGLGLLHSLATVGHDISSIFKGIFLSGSGANPFGALASGLGTVATIVNSPGFQTTLKTIFSGASAGASALAGALVPIGRMLSALAPTIAGVLSGASETVAKLIGGIASAVSQPAFAKGLSAFFAGIESGIAKLLPALPSVAKGLGALGSFVGTLASTVGGVLEKAIVATIPAFVELLKQLTPVITTLGPALASAFQQIAPKLPGLVSAIASILPALATFVANVLPGLMIDIQILTPIIELLLNNGLLPWLKALGELVGFGTPFAQLMGQFLNGLNGPSLAIDQLQGKFGPFVKAFAGWAQELGQDGREWAAAFVGSVNDIIDAMNGLLGAWNTTAGIIAKISGGKVNLKVGLIPQLAVPKAASGMTVSPTSTGTLIDVAEAGRAESIVDTGNMNALINKMLAMQTVPVGASSMPSTVTLVDKDGTFIARMQTEASRVVKTSAIATAQKIRGGRSR